MTLYLKSKLMHSAQYIYSVGNWTLRTKDTWDLTFLGPKCLRSEVSSKHSVIRQLGLKQKSLLGVGCNVAR